MTPDEFRKLVNDYGNACVRAGLSQSHENEFWRLQDQLLALAERFEEKTAAGAQH